MCIRDRDIPGNIIADIAIIPATNTYIANPKFKFVISILVSLPVCGLKYVIADTIIIPIIVNIKFLYFPSIFCFSSFIIKGIAKIIKPINKELT